MYRAPELLMGATDYSYECDIWSLGVLAAELFSGRNPFAGSSELEVFFKIIATLGLPSSESWPRTAFEARTHFPDFRGSPERLHIPSEATSLMYSMLHPERSKRPTAKECLSHPFLSTSTSGPSPLNVPDIAIPDGFLEPRQHLTISRPPKGHRIVGAPSPSVGMGSSLCLDHSTEETDLSHIIESSSPVAVSPISESPNTTTSRFAQPVGRTARTQNRFQQARPLPPGSQRRGQQPPSRALSRGGCSPNVARVPSERTPSPKLGASASFAAPTASNRGLTKSVSRRGAALSAMDHSTKRTKG